MTTQPLAPGLYRALSQVRVLEIRAGQQYDVTTHLRGEVFTIPNFPRSQFFTLFYEARGESAPIVERVGEVPPE